MPAPIPANEVPQRKEILRNDRVTVSLLELAPHEATPMHRHDHDMLAVFVSGGRTQDTMFGHKPAEDTMAVGEVRFRNAGSAHAIKNEGADPFRVVIVELADPQGKMERVGTALHYCNPGSTAACVDPGMGDVGTASELLNPYPEGISASLFWLERPDFWLRHLPEHCPFPIPWGSSQFPGRYGICHNHSRRATPVGNLWAVSRALRKNLWSTQDSIMD